MRRVERWSRRCAACGFAQADLAPGFGRGVEGLTPLQSANDKTTLDEIERHVGGGEMALLDVGCGDGHFLEKAANRGFNVEGVEPAPASPGTTNGWPVHKGPFPRIPIGGSSYDVITFNHSFEHFSEPSEAIARCTGLLRRGGIVALQLPSSRGIIFRLALLLCRMGVTTPWEILWQKGLPSPHVVYFNPTNLRRLVERETDLRFVSEHRLRSIRVAGLWQRVRCRFSLPRALPIFALTALAAPLIGRLAPDFVLLVFKKQAGTPCSAHRDACAHINPTASVE